MASGSADSYARNLNRGDERWSGGSPQSAYMELHRTGIAQLDGLMYTLINGIPRQLTDELMEEMQMGQYGPEGQYRPETQGYTAAGLTGTGGYGDTGSGGGGRGDVGERPHGALSGADTVTSPTPDPNMHSAGVGIEYAGWEEIDRQRTQADREAEFARNNPGARLSRRSADQRAQFDPSGGAEPYFETPRLIPGGSSYEDSWYKGG